jgi:hypothetical protein
MIFRPGKTFAPILPELPKAERIEYERPVRFYPFHPSWADPRRHARQQRVFVKDHGTVSKTADYSGGF